MRINVYENKGFIVLLFIFIFSGCGGSNSDDVVKSNDDKLDTTRVQINSSSAFSSHVKNLSDVEKIRRFNIGDDFFENPWVEKTASTELRDGLGPLFNNNACQDCHIRDGRGQAPGESDENNFASILFKAIKTDIDANQQALMKSGQLSNVGDSSVGSQIQHESIFGIDKEANILVSYEYTNVTFDDGYTVTLRRPIWQFMSLYSDQGFDFNSDTLFSARVAQPMIGLGLLSLINEADIRSFSDPDDINQDGISGKANTVWDIENSTTVLGRFGWKAGQPSLKQQAAGAFSNDMGLTSSLFLNENCLSHQIDCLDSPNGNGDSRSDYPYEVSDDVLEAITFYAGHLAVPERRTPKSESVIAGETIFRNSGCNQCHIEEYRTIHSDEFPELSNQTISPYTDLLLHDMGSALADFHIDNEPGSNQIVEFQATTHEWRTPPLWGIGLTKTVNPDATFLHDGRARTLMEAILWHGGEAERSRNHVLALDLEERKHLIAFLEDL